jgi:hypothetical protein
MMGPVELVAELSTEAQCYNLIKRTGLVGITQTELGSIFFILKKIERGNGEQANGEMQKRGQIK